MEEGSGSGHGQGTGGRGPAEVGATLPFESLFGCVLLPEPAKCFLRPSAAVAAAGPPANGSGGSSNCSGNSGGGGRGSSSSGGGAGGGDFAFSAGPLYERAERAALLALLNDKNGRRAPWPTRLSQAFGGARPAAGKSHSSTNARGGGVAAEEEDDDDEEPPVLLGSPVVDFLQGSYKGLTQVLAILQSELGIYDDAECGEAMAAAARGGGGGARGKGKAAAASALGLRAANTQAAVVDESALQDNEQSWAQCEACEKWRRVPW